MERRDVAINWINVVLAVALFVSPWVLGFTGVAMSNALIAAVVIGAVSLAALAAFAQWEEWVNLIVGVWVAASPWVLGFAVVTSAMWAHVVIGIVVAALAAYELWTMMQNPPRMVSQ